ncbi:GDP/GTP exchange factor [Schizosaccharomyces cryophilus OY26]|uniref:Guanine nucleotide-exchange factor SEC12 n=1 Tax=Schizosaccharomyces cryophilus (strain OY26 / ATCC MYA-4695 / CBS 11777 / NBRC 106824 / NRRL Y48691) TaxID=653667 RepID=S9W6Q4_SCHCR|nr:GDP/GTP exchange factor [Schizosaccharomyces cryophilus OY26]EPY54229.1 GDP/GTP exchange factor [Schizosaccharomyces cryophilus OY26]
MSTSKQLSFPAYAVCWMNKNLLAVGGGGGTTKSGIKNKLQLFFYEETEPEIGEGHTKIELENDVELNSSDDAVMSLDYFHNTLIAGINSSTDGNKNKHLRVFENKDGSSKNYEETQRFQITKFSNDVQYQRLCKYDSHHSVIFVSCTNKKFFIISESDFRVLFEKDDCTVYDVIFGENKFAIAADNRIEVYEWKSFQLLQVLYMPKENATVRGIGMLNEETIIGAYYYVRNGQRYAGLVKFDYSPLERSWVFATMKILRNAKGVTKFCMDPSSGMIIVATADCKIRFMTLDLTTLSINSSHHLPVTDMRLSPDSEVLASVSADGQLCFHYAGKYKQLSTVKLEDPGLLIRFSLMLPFIIGVFYFYLHHLFPGRKMDAIYSFFQFLLDLISKYTVRNSSI